MIDKEKWKTRVKHILSLDSHPGHISAGFAVGVFISFTPFFGLHTAIAIVAAFLFRLNKLTCITGSWVNTPLTVPPVLVVSYKLGRVLLGRSPRELHIKNELSWQYAMNLLDKHGTYLLIGHDHFGDAGGRWLGSLPRFFKLTVMSLFVRQLPKPNFSMLNRRDSMAVLRKLIEAGKITPMVDRTFPLREVPEAIRYLEEGSVKGKIVITMEHNKT